MTSPTRPMAWLSLLIMLMAPRSCRMSSAAMVSLRMRLSAKARSSAMLASRWWHTMSMSTCSSSVLCGVGHGGVGGRWQKVVLTHHAQDVGRVPAARAFGVEGADAAPGHGGDGVLHKARFVERVRVDGDLRVGLVRHIQAVADGRGRGAPVFVQLEADGARVDLLVQRIGQAGVALAEKAQVHGEGIGRLQHALHVEGAGRAGGGQRAGGGAGAAAQHGGHAAGQGFFDLLRGR